MSIRELIDSGQWDGMVDKWPLVSEHGHLVLWVEPVRQGYQLRDVQDNLCIIADTADLDVMVQLWRTVADR